MRLVALPAARTRGFAAALVALVPPHLLGGALGWTVPTIAAITLAALLAVALATRRLPPPQRLDGVVVGLWAWTGLQLLPLPRGLLGWLSPERLEVLRTRTLAGVGDGWLPLSLDPGRTREALVVGAGIVCAYFVGRVVAAREGRRRVLALVLLSTAAMALVAFGHELFSARAVYGLHTPELTRPRLLAPLVNNNHLGAFLAFGVPLGLGFAMGADETERRWAALLAAVLCGAGAIVAVSRGAVVSLVLGLALTGGVALRRRGSKRRAAVTVAVTAGAILALGTYLGLEPLFRDFEGADYSKLELARRSLGIALTFPIAGIGRGAFAPVFARLEDSSNWATHPENILLSWTIEWGVVATVALLSALAPVLLRAARSRQPETACAAAALVALGAHDLVDFALEMPGVAVVAALLLGALATEVRSQPERAAARRRGLGAIVGVAGLVLALLGPQVPGSRPEALAADLAAGAPAEEVARRVAREHPLDPSLALWVGHSLAREGNLRAFGWLNRAMELAPQWPSAHVQAADALARLGRLRQALLEVREAEERVPGSAEPVACRLAAVASEALVLELAPEPKSAFVDRLSHCLEAERVASLDDAALARGLDGPGLRARRARRLLAAGRLDAAATEAARAAELDTDSETARLLWAEVLWRRDGPRAALEHLGTEPESDALLRLRARLASAAGDDERLQADLRLLRRRAAGQPARLARVWAFAGSLEEAEGDLGAALAAFERAHRLQPRDPRYLARVARAAERAQQRRRATAAWERLCEGGDQSACRRRHRLESQAPRRQRTSEGAATSQRP